MTTFNKLAKLYASTHLHDPSWPGLNAPPDQSNGKPFWDTPESAADDDEDDQDDEDEVEKPR